MPKWLDLVGWWNSGWAWLLEVRPYERHQGPAAESPSQTGCWYADGRVAQVGDVVAKPAGRYSVAGMVIRLFPDDG